MMTVSTENLKVDWTFKTGYALQNLQNKTGGIYKGIHSDLLQNSKIQPLHTTTVKIIKGSKQIIPWKKKQK